MIVRVVWATHEVQDVVHVELPPGATLADAVSAAGLVAQYALDPSTLRFAVHGARAEVGTVLTDGDRVEMLGPLKADPKVARARRARAGPAGKHPRDTRCRE